MEVRSVEYSADDFFRNQKNTTRSTFVLIPHIFLNSCRNEWPKWSAAGACAWRWAATTRSASGRCTAPWRRYPRRRCCGSTPTPTSTRRWRARRATSTACPSPSASKSWPSFTHRWPASTGTRRSSRRSTSPSSDCATSIPTKSSPMIPFHTLPTPCIDAYFNNRLKCKRRSLSVARFT